MAFYKVLKTGHFSEEKFNQVGSVIEIDENAAKIAEERGYLKKTTRKPKPIKVKIEVKPKKVKKEYEYSPQKRKITKKKKK